MAQLAVQPTATPPRSGKQGDPCVMVIFGAAGDLTARLLIPALYNLSRVDLLPKEFAVLGVARRPMSDEDFRKTILDDVRDYCKDCIDEATWGNFARRFYYFAGDFNDGQLYPKIKDRLVQIDRDHSTHQNFFYYLATAPSYFGPIVENLAANGLLEQANDHWRRVIIEKPFGHDLE
jgi:glucose-6-phosphate 1-dehydrogenase